MTRHVMTAALLGMACALMMGCQNKVADERDLLYQQAHELQAEKTQLQAERDALDARLRAAPDPAQVQAMQAEISRRDQEIARLQESLRQQPAGQPAQPGLEGIDATYDRRTGNVTVNLPGDVLFAPGDATLKQSALGTLNKLASAIKKDYADKQVYIDGHTDTDPIRRTADKWDDNFDLAYARAKAVMAYLTKQGISDKHVVLRAYGPNMPRQSKAASRRVEIVVATR